VIDGFLFEFQMGEILDAVRLTLCGIGLLAGMVLWIHANYFREGE
tara:strand:- start:5413 stop:5547 length:135 start_codon:yes stop_codon:yes gene_type:complete